MPKVVLSWGLNLGDRQQTLHRMSAALKILLHEAKASSVYANEPMYLPNQPDYWNGIILGSTTIGPFALLRELKAIEQALGRIERERNGPREIDLDIIAYGSLILESHALQLPHISALERRFVCEPWLEVDSEARYAGRNPAGPVRIADHLPELTDYRLVKVENAAVLI